MTGDKLVLETRIDRETEKQLDKSFASYLTSFFKVEG